MGCGCGDASGGGESIVIENNIPDYAQDSVERYVRKARNWAEPLPDGNPILGEDYTGVTYAPQNANETNGIEKLITRARNSPAVVISARTLLQDNLDSLNLNDNPKLDSQYAKLAETLVQEFDEEIIPAIKLEVSMLNMYGSSGFHIRVAKAAEKIASRLIMIGKEVYYDDYVNNKKQQVDSLVSAIDYSVESRRDWELLLQAGYYKKEYTQGALDDSFTKWRASRDMEVVKLELLGNAVRATLGAQRKETKPLNIPGAMAQIAGLASAGAGLISGMYQGGMFKGAPTGVAPTIANSGVNYNPLGGANSWTFGGNSLFTGAK